MLLKKSFQVPIVTPNGDVVVPSLSIMMKPGETFCLETLSEWLPFYLQVYKGSEVVLRLSWRHRGLQRNSETCYKGLLEFT